MKGIKKKLLCSFSVLLTLVSCDKIGQMFPRTPGSEIVFGTSSKRGVNTKAAFSGDVSTNKFERIDWEEGDPIRIYCAQAGEPAEKYADYTITADITPGDHRSEAKITHDPNAIGVRWGTENDHYFSALYPCPTTGSGTAVAENAVTCCLPSVQTNSGISYRKESSKSPIAAPNKNYLFLAGHGAAKLSEKGGPVNLYFDPAVTTFEFTLQNDYASEENMIVTEAGITTTEGKLSGTYEVNVAGIDEGNALQMSSITLTGGDSNTVSMAFSETIAYGDSLTFTLFAQPANNIHHLTFWMKDDQGTKRSFPFKYAEPSRGVEGWVVFTALHKAKIRGILTPEGAGWTINLVPMVLEWGNNGEDVDIDEGNVLTFTSPVVTEWVPEDKGTISYSDL
ncbi:MAG: hypothetical protein MJY89_07955 [Bacteroidales bacterium]|nr:hypothetical protein [Bacteroidales bacterium]